LKKPDAVTVVSRDNFKEKIYSLPVEDLLNIGHATKKKLYKYNIKTIGNLAAADENLLVSLLGKWGKVLHGYALGEDDTPVKKLGEEKKAKSIGNSMTYSEDVFKNEDVKRLIYVISESVSSRLKESDLGKARIVHLWVRDNEMASYGFQKKLKPTALCGDIAEGAFQLFLENYNIEKKPVRALGVTISGFDENIEQLSFEDISEDYDKKAKAEEAVEKIRQKHGYSKLQRGIMYEDKVSTFANLKDEHVIRPAGLRDKNDITSDEIYTETEEKNESDNFKNNKK
jgi:DNA polymerase-4